MSLNSAPVMGANFGGLAKADEVCVMYYKSAPALLDPTLDSFEI